MRLYHIRKCDCSGSTRVVGGCAAVCLLGVMGFLMLVRPSPSASHQVISMSIDESSFMHTDSDVSKSLRHIHNDKIILHDGMDLEQMIEALVKSVYRLEVDCPQSLELGDTHNGGWKVCVNPGYRPSPPCLVYSFGVGWMWGFADAISENYGCTVRAFDPNMDVEAHQHNGLVWFYPVGLAGNNRVNPDGTNYKTLTTILRDMGEEKAVIDYLKIDIEYLEWESLLQMFESGILTRVKQLGVEIHLQFLNTTSLVKKKFGILELLRSSGFRTWHYHSNPYCRHRHNITNQYYSRCSEIVFVNLNFQKRRNSAVYDTFTKSSEEEFAYLSETKWGSDAAEKALRRQNEIHCPRYQRVGRRMKRSEGWDICIAGPLKLSQDSLILTFTSWNIEDIHLVDDLYERYGAQCHSFTRRYALMHHRAPGLYVHMYSQSDLERKASHLLGEGVTSILQATGKQEIDILVYSGRGEEWDELRHFLSDVTLTSKVKQLLLQMTFDAEQTPESQIQLVFSLLKQSSFFLWTSHKVISPEELVPKLDVYKTHQIYRFSFVNTKFIRLG